MIPEISIEIETQNQGDWIKIFIPYDSAEKMTAQMQNENGQVLKLVKLLQGNNAIDISNIKSQSINIKIETAHETILKKIKLS
jgi:hypothetical protein